MNTSYQYGECLMQKEIKKRAGRYGIVAILFGVLLGSVCYNLGYIPQFQLPQSSSLSSFLKTFSNYTELKDFLATNSKTRYPVYYGSLDFLSPAKGQAEAAGNGQYSTTNIQVAGVDEADIVKTDGEYIYLVTGNNVVILRAYPPEQAEVLSKITFSDMYPFEIFVNGDRLAVLGSKSNYPAPYNYPLPSRYYYDSFGVDTETFAKIYDISDREKPQLLRTFTTGGSYFNSRMIGKYVYFVASQLAYLVTTTLFPNVTIETVNLPKMSSNDHPKEVSPSEIYYSNTSDNYYSFTTFVAMNIQNATEEPTYMSLMMGGTSGMYVSLSNIYVTIPESYGGETSIYRIRVKDNNFTCEAQGKVPGHELNQFSMDEYNNYFRIATTSWNYGVTQNNLYILDMNMSVVGRLENLANNENLHSARFMGNRCYLVTFKKVDPLFVIDLTEPTSPTVLGQLKIPGYSDYLHPYDENYLIGVGKETAEAEEGDFAWYQGVKISLFNVSDVNHPTQVANYTIGDRGTDSPILTDHKAFLFDKSKNLLVIPVSVAEIDPSQYPYGVPKSAYGQPVWQGAYVFNISLDGFTLKGNITHIDSDTQISNYTYWVKRSLYIDNVLYTVSDMKVKLNSLEDLALIKEIDLS